MILLRPLIALMILFCVAYHHASGMMAFQPVDKFVYGIISDRGEKVLEPNAYEIVEFPGDRFLVHRLNPITHQEETSIIDFAGKQLFAGESVAPQIETANAAKGYPTLVAPHDPSPKSVKALDGTNGVRYDIGGRPAFPLVPADEGQPFAGNTAIVTKRVFQHVRASAIDRSGKLLMPFKYDQLYHYGRDALVAVDGDVWLILRDGQEESTLPVKCSAVETGAGWVRNYYGFNSSKNDDSIQKNPNQLGIDRAEVFDRLYPCALGEPIQPPHAPNDGNGWQYVDSSGRVAITTAYEHAWPFLAGTAMVRVKSEDGRSKFGTIDQKGNWVIKPIYDVMCRCGPNRFIVGLSRSEHRVQGRETELQNLIAQIKNPGPEVPLMLQSKVGGIETELKRLKLAVRHNQECSEAVSKYVTLAQTASADGLNAVAVKSLARAIEIAPRRYLYQMRADNYLKLEQDKEALQDYERSDNEQVFEKLNRLRLKLRLFSAVISDCSKALATDAGAAAYLLRSEAYSAMGEKQKAIEDAREAYYCSFVFGNLEKESKANLEKETGQAAAKPKLKSGSADAFLSVIQNIANIDAPFSSEAAIYSKWPRNAHAVARAQATTFQNPTLSYEKDAPEVCISFEKGVKNISPRINLAVNPGKCIVTTEMVMQKFGRQSFMPASRGGCILSPASITYQIKGRTVCFQFLPTGLPVLNVVTVSGPLKLTVFSESVASSLESATSWQSELVDAEKMMSARDFQASRTALLKAWVAARNSAWSEFGKRTQKNAPQESGKNMEDGSASASNNAERKLLERNWKDSSTKIRKSLIDLYSRQGNAAVAKYLFNVSTVELNSDIRALLQGEREEFPDWNEYEGEAWNISFESSSDPFLMMRRGSCCLVLHLHKKSFLPVITECVRLCGTLELNSSKKVPARLFNGKLLDQTDLNPPPAAQN